MEITLRILCLLVGYLLGSFLTAECIARRLTGRYSHARMRLLL